MRPMSRPLTALATLLCLVLALLVAPVSAKTYVERQRPPKIVRQDDGALVVRDVRWGFDAEDRPIFRTVTIRPDKIQDVYFWNEAFPPEWLAAHGMLAFVMKDETGVVTDRGESDIGFVLSVEAYQEVGESYSLVRGLGKAFELVFLLTSIKDRLQFSVSGRNHRLDALRLKLDRRQKEQLVINTVLRSCENRDDAVYNTIYESCVTNATALVNTVLPKKQQMALWVIDGALPNLFVSFPKTTPLVFRSHGVGEKAPRIPPFTRHIRFPDGNGSEHVIDMAQFPNWYVPKKLLPFQENFELFCRYAGALDVLVRLQSVLSPMDERFFLYQSQIPVVEENLEDAHRALMTCMDEDFVGALRHFCSLELPENSSIERLKEIVVEKIDYRLLQPETADRETLESLKAQLVGED